MNCINTYIKTNTQNVMTPEQKCHIYPFTSLSKNVIGLVTFFLASDLSILQIPTRRNDLFVQSKKKEKKGQKKAREGQSS